jgi:hypothetical protein
VANCVTAGVTEEVVGAEVRVDLGEGVTLRKRGDGDCEGEGWMKGEEVREEVPPLAGE